MKLKIVLVFLINILLTNICNGQQTDKTETEKSFLFSTGLISQGNLFGEVNLIFGEVTVINVPKFPPIIGVSGIRIGFESNFRDKENYIIAPKIGYEYSLLFFAVRLSAINYFQNENSEFRLLPEIGLSLLGKINLTYGYGINFNDGNINGLSNHRIGLSINLNKKLNEGIKEFLK